MVLILFLIQRHWVWLWSKVEIRMGEERNVKIINGIIRIRIKGIITIIISILIVIVIIKWIIRIRTKLIG